MFSVILLFIVCLSIFYPLMVFLLYLRRIQCCDDMIHVHTPFTSIKDILLHFPRTCTQNHTKKPTFELVETTIKKWTWTLLSSTVYFMSFNNYCHMKRNTCSRMFKGFNKLPAKLVQQEISYLRGRSGGETHIKLWFL